MHRPPRTTPLRGGSRSVGLRLSPPWLVIFPHPATTTTSASGVWTLHRFRCPIGRPCQGGVWNRPDETFSLRAHVLVEGELVGLSSSIRYYLMMATHPPIRRQQWMVPCMRARTDPATHHELTFYILDPTFEAHAASPPGKDESGRVPESCSCIHEPRNDLPMEGLRVHYGDARPRQVIVLACLVCPPLAASEEEDDEQGEMHRKL